MISDLELQGHVLDELEFEPSVNAAHIGVIANKGVVTLTGFVMSYVEKLAAERAARRVKGVKAIAEEAGYEMPSFFGYALRAMLTLAPIYVVFVWLMN